MFVFWSSMCSNLDNTIAGGGLLRLENAVDRCYKRKGSPTFILRLGTPRWILSPSFPSWAVVLPPASPLQPALNGHPTARGVRWTAPALMAWSCHIPPSACAPEQPQPRTQPPLALPPLLLLGTPERKACNRLRCGRGPAGPGSVGGRGRKRRKTAPSESFPITPATPISNSFLKV